MTYQPGDGVALLAEGVDRNVEWWKAQYDSAKVALLAEGVDRNESDLEEVTKN